MASAPDFKLVTLPHVVLTQQKGGPRRGRWLGAAGALLVGMIGLAAAGQPSDPLGTGEGSGGRGTVKAGTGQEGSAGQIQIKVRSFGVANQVRPGEWAGIYLEITDASDKPRTVVLRLNVPDVDGDTAFMQRAVTTTPGERRGVWLYARIPGSDGVGSTYLIEAFEAEEAAGAPDPRFKYTPGRLLGQTRYQNPTAWPFYDGLVAIVGRREAGLEQYRWMVSATRGDPITGHELTSPFTMSVGDLPDRWIGLEASEALVWAGAGSEDQPGLLRAEQADAIREYVRRGGHLVIILPPVGQTWLGAPANPLADIMPRVVVEKRENVDLAEYRTLLTRDTRAKLPNDATVQVMAGEGEGPYEAIPIMAGVDGGAVVMRRLVGAGAVTVIGLDVVSPKLHSISGGFQADQFWHRILGKRGLLLPPDRLQAEIDGKATTNRLWQANRSPLLEFDGPIGGLIAKSASAAAGVLLALVVFVAYWIIAGPGGFFALRSRNRIQHSWVAFVLAGLAFTGIGWGGANLLKTRRVEGQHFSLVDVVHGQPLQRARSWMSLVLPRYGQERVGIAAPENLAGGAGWHNLLAPWAPAIGGTTISAFPDARGYVMDARSPDTADFPARATVKQVEVQWSGGLPPTWGIPTPVAGVEVPLGQEIRVVPRDDPEADPQLVPWKIQGVLRHALPGALKDVTVIYMRSPQPGYTGDAVPLMGYARRVQPADWAPGESLDLGVLFADVRRTVNSRDRIEDLLRALRGEGSTAFTGAINGPDLDRDVGRALNGLSFFSMLTPPGRTETAAPLARRRVTHGWDLGRWFTQPCLIVIGELESTELPIPVSVGGASPDVIRRSVVGRTVVRWVYPLPAEPFKPGQPAAPTPAAVDDPAAGSSPEPLPGSP